MAAGEPPRGSDEEGVGGDQPEASFDWASHTERVGDRIRNALSVPGTCRRDLLADKSCLGRVIGPRGSTFRSLVAAMSCEIFVLDKEGPPPGCSQEQRLIVLIGREDKVLSAEVEVASLLKGGATADKDSGGTAGTEGGDGNGSFKSETSDGSGIDSAPSSDPSGAPEAESGAPSSMPPVSRADSTNRIGGDWPLQQPRVGARIAMLETVSSLHRHDLIVDKSVLGRLIGPSGAAHRALVQQTKCEIFLLDKQGPPPGYTAEQRLVVLIGGQAQVAHAVSEINAVIERAARGEPPLPLVEQQHGMPLGYRSSSGPRSPTLSSHAARHGTVSDSTHVHGSRVIEYTSDRLAGDWPLLLERVGSRIAALEAAPGLVRKDLIVEKSALGRIIGPGGSTYRSLVTATGCDIFVIDKEGSPPGYPPNQRLIVMIGWPEVVAHAYDEIVAALRGSAATAPLRNGTEMGAGAPVGHAMGTPMPSVQVPMMYTSIPVSNMVPVAHSTMSLNGYSTTPPFAPQHTSSLGVNGLNMVAQQIAPPHLVMPPPMMATPLPSIAPAVQPMLPLLPPTLPAPVAPRPIGAPPFREHVLAPVPRASTRRGGASSRHAPISSGRSTAAAAKAGKPPGPLPTNSDGGSGGPLDRVAAGSPLPNPTTNPNPSSQLDRLVAGMAIGDADAAAAAT